ncbi:MAG: PhoU domain-containing protein, partial [Pseudomonadota bacterium]
MTEHIVSAYTDELEALSADILRMGGLAEAMTGDACEATVKSDDTLATMVVARDADVDALEADIE